jgi:aldehyde:ferredoxin oxidoreductase
MWGKRVLETTKALGQNNNRRNVLCIGPAGETLSRMAAIMNDGERSLARGGPGAVMGSKGMELPAYDPRGMQGQGLLYATSNRGGCHMRGNMLGLEVMANNLAKALQSYKIVMLRGHGSFAIGQTLDEAFFWSSTLEEACQIMLIAKQINEPFIEYRKMSGAYNKW